MTARSDDHVSFRTLLDRRDGRLSPVRAAIAGGHLGAACAVCEANVRAIEELVTAIADGPPPSPPRHAVDAAIRLYRDTQAAFTRQADRILGTLVLDSAPQFEVALRGAADESRRLLWRVGGYEVDASLVARPGGADLVAQIVPDGDDPNQPVAGDVVVVGARGVKSRTTIEADGRFTFRRLVPGVYTLEGRVDTTRFVLPPIHVE